MDPKKELGAALKSSSENARRADAGQIILPN